MSIVSRVLITVLLAMAMLATAVTVWADHPPPDSREAPAGKIVGGQEADIGEWPWQILMFASGGQCGGSILSTRWILTAAHCVVNSAGILNPPEFVEIRAGIHNQSDAGQRIRAESILPHPSYNGSVSQGFDIALIYLSSDLVLGTTTRAQAISMVTTADSALVVPGTTSTVTGWGTTSSGGQVSQTLLEVALPIVSNTQCNNVYGGILGSMICAGGTPQGGTDSCQGDSGGPLVVPDGGSGWKLAGIVSFGVGCADPNVPGVYTRVSSFVNEVNAQMSNGRPLSVAKTLDNATPGAGASITYTVTVQNLKNSTATNVVLTDTLPQGIALTSATPDQGSCSTGSSTSTNCSLGSLSPQASTKVVIQASVPSALTGATVNNARGSSGEQSWPSVGAAGTALTITVSTTTDAVLGTDGVCSLREAVLSASTNKASGSATGECPAGSNIVTDKIMIPVGTYRLTRSGTANDQGSLFISSGQLLIVGASTTGTIIDATGLGDQVILMQTASTTISNLTIKGGQSSAGGGIRVVSSATATLNWVNVTGNTSTGGAGGIRNEGALTINNSTISMNTSGGYGGGIYNIGSGTLTISRSTISANTATNGAGGIESNGGDVTILNSTISGNTANGDDGGGIEHDSNSGVLSINNSTIANNVASSTNDGGGIAVTNGTVKIRNSILADNTADGNGPDCSASSGDPLTSEDYNLIEITSGCAVTGAISNSIIGQDPKLGALADNGGPTKTHALLAGSPALDKGNTAIPAITGLSCLPTDQRGISRPQGSACDIGAFELLVTSPSADLEVIKTGSPNPVTAGTNLTYVVTVTNKSSAMSLSVEITDNLATGTAFVSASASQGSCGHNSGVVLCNLQDLTGSATATATIVVKVASTTTGNLTNSVTVTSPTADPVSSNNSASATTTVNPLKADLEVIKTGSPNPVTAGTNLTYTIKVTNKSSSTSSNVQITDALPSGTTLVSMSATAGSCSESAGVVTCSFGDLAGGAMATATIVVKVNSTTTGSLVNIATTTSQTLDDVVSNNSFKAVTQVTSAQPIPSVSPWALLILSMVLLLTFSSRLRRTLRRHLR